MSAGEPEPGAHRRLAGESWPLYAAGAAVLATLTAVFAMLHPRGTAAAGQARENAPARVTADKAELRRGPSSGSAAIGAVDSGARVRVRSEAGQWVEVEAESGERGYLPVEAVESDADREARERRAKTLLGFAPVYGVVGQDTDIVLAPFPLAARGGRLSKGSVIAIHSVDGSYFAFANKKWGLAFVRCAHVDVVPPDPREPAVAPEKVKPLKDLTVIDLEGQPPPEEEALEEKPGAEEPPPPVAREPAPGLLEAPAVLSRTEPAYPEPARRAGIEGTVELEVSIDAAGKVTDVEVVRGLPLGLSEAAADAVHRWTFRPARAASGPVASRQTVRIRFVSR